jgi:cytochrome c-type biogenesis protein
MDESFLLNYSEFLENKSGSFVFLIIFGFLGGLISSLLPCVLSLLPVNLAYIGTLNIESKKSAFLKAGSFVLGVSLVMALLGVFGGLAFSVFNEYRGVINLGVGLLILAMSLALLDIFKLPMPQLFKSIPETNPFVVGLVFALVSSPCSSPVLISVISIASNLGSLVLSLILMFAYSLGYTTIIFFASLSTGLIKQLDWFKKNSDTIIKFSAVILAIVAVFYIYSGIQNLSF